jgi:hypothetical protein
MLGFDGIVNMQEQLELVDFAMGKVKIGSKEWNELYHRRIFLNSTINELRNKFEKKQSRNDLKLRRKARNAEKKANRAKNVADKIAADKRKEERRLRHEQLMLEEKTVKGKASKFIGVNIYKLQVMLGIRQPKKSKSPQDVTPRPKTV